MPTSTIAVLGIFLGFAVLELWRTQLFAKGEQTRDDGIVEGISMTMLLAVTQPGIVFLSAAIMSAVAPGLEGALADINIFLAIALFLVLEDMTQYWWHRASHTFPWLYNLHRAATASRKTERVIVAEGYMDVIALAAAGIEDAVAPMGTALTEQQIELLWRMADKPVLCFDGDKAGTRAAMRAAERALPLLRPGHSLQVVQLPAGLDPDDLIKRDGRKGMDKVLGEQKSLLDLLWQHERDAAPLASPEDKAGLKARLLEHTDAIQHPDIRSLYRRELLDRYSAFAFPPRDFPNRNDFRQGNSSRGNRPFDRNAPQRTPPHVTQRLRKATTGAFRDMLTAAVLNGLARHPREIHRHADALLGLAKGDAQLAQPVNFLLDHPQELEAAANLPISGQDSLPPAPDNTRFSFLLEGSDPDEAREDLAEAVALLVERPALEAAIAEATRRFESDPEGAFAEQQRLRKRKLEIDSRLGQMARKRAASQALETQDEEAGELSATEQETD